MVKRGDKETRYKGLQFLLGHAVPNFYFHVTTTYNILRHNGIEIGKRDYLGSWQEEFAETDSQIRPRTFGSYCFSTTTRPWALRNTW